MYDFNDNVPEFRTFDVHVPEIEKKIGYVFHDKSLLRQAFTRSSYENEHPDLCRSNEVPEFFGDTVLSCAIVSYFIDHMTERRPYGVEAKFAEGGFSNIKSKLSDKKNLSASMTKLGLQEYLIMGEGDRKLGIENEASVMEDLFESILGAVFVDSDKDMGAVSRVVGNMLDVGNYLASDTPVMQSYKNALQEFCASKLRRLPSPVYEPEKAEGPDHEKIFTVRCSVAGVSSLVGIGKNLKSAENAAAENVLRDLKAKEESGKLVFEAPSDDDGVNYIGKVMEDAAKYGYPTPVFADGDPVPGATQMNPRFTVTCSYRGCVGSGTSSTKKAAKKIAAKQVAEALGL